MKCFFCTAGLTTLFKLRRSNPNFLGSRSSVKIKETIIRVGEWEYVTTIIQSGGKYPPLVYAKQFAVNIHFCALLIGYPSSGYLLVCKHNGRAWVITFSTEFWPDKIHFLSLAIHWFHFNYSPTLRWIIVLLSLVYKPDQWRARDKKRKFYLVKTQLERFTHVHVHFVLQTSG